MIDCLTHSESLKLLLQQFGAYRPGIKSVASRPSKRIDRCNLPCGTALICLIHSRLRCPHRWHGICPLHLILRRLHSLLNKDHLSASSGMSPYKNRRRWLVTACNTACSQQETRKQKMGYSIGRVRHNHTMRWKYTGSALFAFAFRWPVPPSSWPPQRRGSQTGRQLQTEAVSSLFEATQKP